MRTKAGDSILHRLAEFNAFGSDFIQFIFTEVTGGTSNFRGPSGRTSHSQASKVCRKYNLGLCGDGSCCCFQHISLKC
jgi:hypothetical protein